MPRRDPRRDRRQRRRQVDADQGALRRGHPRQRRDPARRQAGPLPLADRRARRPASRPSTRTSRCRRRCRSPTTCSSAARARKPGIVGTFFRTLDRAAHAREAREKLTELGLLTIQNINQPVETLSGGQRQGVAVARAAAFGSRVVIMDEPTAALGVKESRKVLELILDVRARGLPIILISHNMPHVFEVADRIHIHRLGRRHRGDRPQGLLDVRRGRDHDRRHEAAGGGARRVSLDALAADIRAARRRTRALRLRRRRPPRRRQVDLRRGAPRRARCRHAGRGGAHAHGRLPLRQRDPRRARPPAPQGRAADLRRRRAGARPRAASAPAAARSSSRSSTATSTWRAPVRGRSAPRTG